MPPALIALAVGGFGIGLTEFVIVGLLPEVADTYQVSEAIAGWLISGYALTVAIGGLLLTVIVNRFPRKAVLVGLMVFFIAGNLLSAMADTYLLMLMGRILAALTHGAFFGIGAVVAGDMVEPQRKGMAIAIMFSGLTAANVLGVPFGTFLGQSFGWRSTFYAISVFGIVAMIGMAILIPRQHSANTDLRLRDELKVFIKIQVWITLIVTILAFGGMFGAFGYIKYTLTQVSGFDIRWVPWLLVLFGAGLFMGNIIGGKAADRTRDKSLIVIFCVLTVILVIFALTASSKSMAIIMLFLMAFCGFAMVPGLQMRITQYGHEAPTLVSGANIAAFNVGNFLGIWLSGLTIEAKLGYTSPLWVGAILSALAFIVILIGARPALTTGYEAKSAGTDRYK